MPPLPELPDEPSTPNPPPSNPGGTTTGSTTSSSTQGNSNAEAQMLMRLRVSFRDILRRWGFKPNKNLLNLIEKAVRGRWSTTQFIDQLRHTPEYRQQFRGLQWRTGMTEGQYLQTYAQYKSRAQDIGEQFTKKDFAKALRRGVTYDEFSDRIDAIESIEQYPALAQQMRFELLQAGIPVGPKVTKKELVDLAMGLGSKKWEKVWEQAFLTVQLEKVAGIEVVESKKGETATPDTFEIMRKDLIDIIKKVEALNPGKDLEKLGSPTFAELGTKLRSFKMSYLQKYGITTQDIIEMELGGPGAAKTAEKANRILAEQEAFYEPRAVPQQFAGIGQQTLETDRDQLPQSY